MLWFKGLAGIKVIVPADEFVNFDRWHGSIGRGPIYANRNRSDVTAKKDCVRH